MSPFAIDLQRRRTERGWSRAHLARRTALDVTLISRIELGKRPPTVNTLRRLSAALCDSSSRARNFTSQAVKPGLMVLAPKSNSCFGPS